MRLVDKLFGRSRILTLGKLHYQSHDGEPVTISKDLRYTIRCGNSTLHMYEWQDVKDHCKKFGYTPVPWRAGGGQISSSFVPETGVGSHAKNREIKRGIAPQIK